MSIVPQENLKPVNSDTLKTFEIPQALDNLADPFRFDAITLYDSFWKVVTIRNFNDLDAIYYRTDNGVPYDTIPPLSERDIPGWGSYFEVSKDPLATFQGKIIFQLVKRNEALVKPN